MKFFIVDAFTKTPFGGNPAGVMLLDEGSDYPSEEFMTKTAAELRYSETAFIKQLAPGEFQIRYFTPAAEVELCGHATIASFAALLHGKLIEDEKDYVCRTLAGTLNISLRNGFVMMDMASPEMLGVLREQEALEELYAVMGLPFEPVFAPAPEHSAQLFPTMVSTGLPDIIMPVKDRETLASISPDFDALSELSKKYQVVGVHAFALDARDQDVTAFCRNFAPLYDIDEEAATGTSNGALTYYLFEHGLIHNDAESTFLQGESMGRPSAIVSRLQAQGETVTIQVGGNAVILAEGFFANNDTK